ncbi:hypothetical protein [Bradyrhizobium sp. Tv2a-2]|uniref:hypothetical protein n=1 Tax=Bradyrhizobium sp. Tv2a-2 TaxID=113395 RepID=UPI00040A6CBC|nr:hypothetical protein [Bradyrhizobium sp. Tv2a-2]
MSGNLENFVFSCIDRYHRAALGGSSYHERHAIVTSYDPERYLAKVMYMPEGQESGWLPIETGHIGSDYGFAVGLQPGDGKKSGDQVIVRFQEGDLESGKIVQRVHSDDDKPPTVQSGEMVMWAKFKKSTGKSTIGDDSTDDASGSDNDQASDAQGGSGQQFYFKNDGSATITDGNGATIVMDGKGNITLTCNNLSFKIGGNWISDIAKVMTAVAGSDLGLSAGNNAQIASGNITGIEGASFVNLQGGGTVSDGSVSPSQGGSMQPPTTVTP